MAAFRQGLVYEAYFRKRLFVAAVVVVVVAAAARGRPWERRKLMLNGKTSPLLPPTRRVWESRKQPPYAGEPCVKVRVDLPNLTRSLRAAASFARPTRLRQTEERLKRNPRERERKMGHG